MPSTLKDPIMEKPTLLLTPLKSAVPDTGGYLDMLVRVQAPDRPEHAEQQHTPKRLALVVDRSGSMEGQPLREALRCVVHIAKHMTPEDQMSLVVYDDSVNVLVPLQSMNSLSIIEDAVHQVFSGGSTDLFAGWLEGARQLEGGNNKAISRVLLLSDGQANHGETNMSAIEAQCKQWYAKGVSTTTVGLGRSFNEDLMIAMAHAGGGQQYYGQRAEDLYDNFDEELSLLKAMYLRQINIKFLTAPGVIVEVLGLTKKNDDGTYRMNDLAYGAESWIAVRCHLSPSALGTSKDILAVSIKAMALDGTSLEQSSPVLQLPVIDALEHHRATLKKLEAMEQRFGEHAWLKAKMAQLHRLAEVDMDMMMKEASFSSMKMSSRLASKSETLYMGDETESFMPAFLRKKESEGRGRKNET
jgi:Ca-activated chloride channel family protein